jgi:hypothetical protein
MADLTNLESEYISNQLAGRLRLNKPPKEVIASVILVMGLLLCTQRLVIIRALGYLAVVELR